MRKRKPKKSNYYKAINFASDAHPILIKGSYNKALNYLLRNYFCRECIRETEEDGVHPFDTGCGAEWTIEKK